jgi:hypothetical protein
MKMGAIEDIFTKPANKLGLRDIQKLIDDNREETRNLEYKAPQFAEKGAELSEWVSAFLNADGGLIILGMCESDPNKKNNINAKIYPTKIEYVESRFTKESIEQIIFSNIGCSSKPDIKIYPVRDSNDPLKAIYLIDIPQGDNPPYQAQNKKYYRRLNATKYELPHSEIADFFGRRRKPKLLLTCRVTDPKNPNSIAMKRAIEHGSAGVATQRSSYNLQLIVSNIGHAAAKHTRITVSFENIDITKIISGPNNRIDNLRDGLPTLQWDNPIGIIYGDSHGGDVVWDLQVKLQKDKWGTIAWQARAEEMDYIEDKFVLLGFEATKPGDEKKPYWLPRYQDFWNRNQK